MLPTCAHAGRPLPWRAGLPSAQGRQSHGRNGPGPTHTTAGPGGVEHGGSTCPGGHPGSQLSHHPPMSTLCLQETRVLRVPGQGLLADDGACPPRACPLPSGWGTCQRPAGAGTAGRGSSRAGGSAAGVGLGLCWSSCSSFSLSCEWSSLTASPLCGRRGVGRWAVREPSPPGRAGQHSPGCWAPAPSAGPAAWRAPRGGAGAGGAAACAAARSPSCGEGEGERERPVCVLQAASPARSCPPALTLPPGPAAPRGGGEQEAVEQAAAEFLQGELLGQQRQVPREQVQKDVAEGQVAEGLHCGHSKVSRPPPTPSSDPWRTAVQRFWGGPWAWEPDVGPGQAGVGCGESREGWGPRARESEKKQNVALIPVELAAGGSHGHQSPRVQPAGGSEVGR